MSVHAVFIAGFLLRYTIGRKVFPCALYTLLYFLLPAAVSLPTTLRCIRIYTLYRLNLFKTNIFDIDHVPAKPSSDKEKNHHNDGSNQALKHQTGTSNGAETPIIKQEEEEEELMETSSSRMTAQVSGSTDEKHTIVDNKQQQEPSPSSTTTSQVVLLLPPADTSGMTDSSAIVTSTHTTTTTATTTNTPTAVEDEALLKLENPMSIIVRQQQAIDGLSSLSSVHTDIITNNTNNNMNNTDPTDDKEFTFTLNSKSVWDISDSSQEVKAQIRIMQTLSFLSSYKFMILSYSVLIVFQVVLWLLFGGIEEIIFSSSSSQQQENQRVFLLEGGLFVFNHGCGLSTNFIIIFACVSILYIVLEIIALILCFRADRDTWNMKRDTILLVILQVICVILFGITGNVSFIVNLTDYLLPYGYTLVMYSFFEILIYMFVPLLKALREEKRFNNSDSHRSNNHHHHHGKNLGLKMMWSQRRHEGKSLSPSSSVSTPTNASMGASYKNTQHQSEIERILLNKRTYDIMLDFARRSYCVESVLAWRDIRRFKSSRIHKKKIAQHIVNTYLTVGSPFELNISNIEKKRQEYLTILNSDTKITSPFFDKLEEHCLYDMRDVFTRLRNANKEIDDLVNSFD
ncbi:hypothetical protein FDP41_004577 [Naegleria fowleri]|uniref:Uncharacterized protein n=1 Tax=Naegleria fowleri TaxID=5763 RepID=A0A6A5BR34_NAEFO|nr:uncharacterized protein FDP41_004577 [Naegleria fowleri]KAF0976678.1 hypothetical protein FDP41_004577 [Naegleria fowleri]